VSLNLRKVSYIQQSQHLYYLYIQHVLATGAIIRWPKHAVYMNNIELDKCVVIVGYMIPSSGISQWDV
jgi:hypothetical protein